MMNTNTRPVALCIALAGAVALAAACSRKQPDAAVEARTLVFKPQESIPVSLTLQKAEGQSGRTSPISNNYRPQVRFAPAPEELGCTVQFPAATPSLEPGQTSPAVLSCDAEARVEPAKREFVILEGGKQVGHGVVELPSGK